VLSDPIAKPGANCQMLEKADPHRRPMGGMNPLVSVGTPRPLGFSAWRNVAHRILVRVESVHSALVQNR